MPRVAASFAEVQQQRSSGMKRPLVADSDTCELDEEWSASLSRPPAAALPSGARKGARASSKKARASNHSGPTQYHGVTHHVRSDRFESHIWQDGKQLYLGGYAAAEQAALAYDLAALRYRGAGTKLNYHIGYYQPYLAALMQHSPEEVVAGLRRHSKGGAVQTSVFRGVTRHQKGRWEARIGQTAGRRYLYLGLHSTECEAARAYDVAALEQKGVDAVSLLNFHLSEYLGLLEPRQVDEALGRGIITAEDLARARERPAAAAGGTEETEMEAQAEAGVDTDAARRALTSSCDEDALAEALFGVITKDGMELSPQSVLAPRGAPPAGQEDAAAAAKGEADPLALLSLDSLVCQLFA